MNFEEKLKSLLRERELAERKNPDPRLFVGPDKGRFWGTILRGLPKSKAAALRESWGNALLDAMSPPPQTDKEQRLSDQNRTLEEIDAEIASIPPVSVERHIHAPDNLPDLDGRAIVMSRIMKERNPYGNSSIMRKKHVVSLGWRPSNHEDLAYQLGAMPANQETKLFIEEDARSFPMRSHSNLTEEQNHDPAHRVDIDGRHFRQDLLLSKPLYAALLEGLPKPDKSRPYLMDSHHVLYFPIEHDDTPRDVPYGDKTPYIKFPESRLTQLLVAEFSSAARDAKLLRVISLTEGD